MISEKRHLYITLANAIVLLILLTILFFNLTQKKDEIVYVDNIKLFNGFNMIKDLNQINGLKINRQKKKLDSLYTIYGIFRDNNQTDKLEGLEAQLRNEDEELKKMNQRFSDELSQTVWKRLNVYVKEYSVTKGYKIVLGTQGSGNVMFAEDGIDITDAIIEYSNSNYEGNQ